MSVLVILEIQVKPENVSIMKSGLAEALVDTRAYDGCQKVDVYSNADDPGNMVLIERWDSRAHYEKYLAWRTETGFFDKTAAMLAKPPSIRYFERIDM